MNMLNRPDPTNRDRAQWAKNALNTFREETMPNEDDATTMQDLLTNLQHLASINELDFANILRRATNNFKEEVAEETAPV